MRIYSNEQIKEFAEALVLAPKLRELEADHRSGKLASLNEQDWTFTKGLLERKYLFYQTEREFFDSATVELFDRVVKEIPAERWDFIVEALMLAPGLRHLESRLSKKGAHPMKLDLPDREFVADALLMTKRVYTIERLVHSSKDADLRIRLLCKVQERKGQVAREHLRAMPQAAPKKAVPQARTAEAAKAAPQKKALQVVKKAAPKAPLKPVQPAYPYPRSRGVEPMSREYARKLIARGELTAPLALLEQCGWID